MAVVAANFRDYITGTNMTTLLISHSIFLPLSPPSQLLNLYPPRFFLGICLIIFQAAIRLTWKPGSSWSFRTEADLIVVRKSWGEPLSNITCVLQKNKAFNPPVLPPFHLVKSHWQFLPQPSFSPRLNFFIFSSLACLLICLSLDRNGDFYLLCSSHQLLFFTVFF